jgi:hypothetical protein
MARKGGNQRDANGTLARHSGRRMHVAWREQEARVCAAGGGGGGVPIHNPPKPPTPHKTRLFV